MTDIATWFRVVDKRPFRVRLSFDQAFLKHGVWQPVLAFSLYFDFFLTKPSALCALLIHNATFSVLILGILIYLFTMLQGHRLLVFLIAVQMTHLDGGICCLQALYDQCFTEYIFLHLQWLPCINSMFKNCRAVCIYNNTACSHCVCVCALHDYMIMAGHRFMCWSVVGLCRRCPPC